MIVIFHFEIPEGKYDSVMIYDSNNLIVCAAAMDRKTIIPTLYTNRLLITFGIANLNLVTR